METYLISEPIDQIPIGPRSYPVAQITIETVQRLRPTSKIIAKSSNKPMAGEIALAYATTIREMIVGNHSELTDDYIISWLSQALCIMVALEYQRQFLVVMNFARA